MDTQNVEKIKIILNQYSGPVMLSYQTKSISNVTEKLVMAHIKNINNFENYNINELFGLYKVIEYAILDLGEDEFNTVTGLDLYNDGYKVLNFIKNRIIKF